MKKKLLSLLLALVMTATLLPVQAMAAEGGLAERCGLKTVYTGEYVNPLYADALGAETSGWSQPKASTQWASDVQTAANATYLTEAEAVKCCAVRWSPEAIAFRSVCALRPPATIGR